MNVVVVIAPASSWTRTRGFRHAIVPGAERTLCGKNANLWQIDGKTIDGIPFVEAAVGCHVCKRAHRARTQEAE